MMTSLCHGTLASASASALALALQGVALALALAWPWECSDGLGLGLGLGVCGLVNIPATDALVSVFILYSLHQYAT